MYKKKYTLRKINLKIILFQNEINFSKKSNQNISLYLEDAINRIKFKKYIYNNYINYNLYINVILLWDFLSNSKIAPFHIKEQKSIVGTITQMNIHENLDNGLLKRRIEEFLQPVYENFLCCFRIE